jgi:two-component system, sensor histidine kinase LadS
VDGRFPRTYPPEWETIIDAAGYIGLAPFLAFLGSIFERTRAQAQDQLRAALEKLSLANERLERLNRDKDEFMNIAAHDLRNPLGGIIGFAGVLKLPGEPNAALVKQAGETIESLGVRMNGILSNLLDIRRIEEGKLNLKPERCTYQAIVSEVVLSFRQQAEAKRITVLSELPGDAPAFVGDRNVTAQIFENLLSNAIKYSPAGSTVRCTVDLCGEHVKLNVVDNGPGLSENDQRNLFKKFAKLAPRPTAGENSNGLGLWIVQKMAQAMNGNVTCFSKQGSGSTFSLHLPLAA